MTYLEIGKYRLTGWKATGTLVVMAYSLIILAIAACFLVWSFTGAPMLRNYAECGTVFLCSAQP